MILDRLLNETRYFENFGSWIIKIHKTNGSKQNLLEILSFIPTQSFFSRSILSVLTGFFSSWNESEVFMTPIDIESPYQANHFFLELKPKASFLCCILHLFSDFTPFPLAAPRWTPRPSWMTLVSTIGGQSADHCWSRAKNVLCRWSRLSRKRRKKSKL